MIQTFDFTILSGEKLSHFFGGTIFNGGPATCGGVRYENLSRYIQERRQEEFEQKAQVISCLANLQAIRSIQFFPTKPEQYQTWYIENHTGSLQPTYDHFFKPYATFRKIGGVPADKPEVPMPLYFYAKETPLEELEETLSDVQDEEIKAGLKEALLLSRDDLQTDKLAVTFRDEGILKTKVWSWIHPEAEV